MNDLTFTFSTEKINRILERLATFPYNEVADLIADIHMQAQGPAKPVALPTAQEAAVAN